MALKLPPRFVNVPAGIIFNTHLPDAIFRTLAQLHGLAWQTKGERTPPATVAEFAHVRGLKERRMYDHLRELKKAHYIRVKNLGNGQIIIFPLRWDAGAALPTDDDNLETLRSDDNALPLRWESDAALSTSATDEIFTAKDCSKIAKDCSGRSSCSFKNSDSDSKKQPRQQQTTITAKNCSKLSPAYQPLLDLLVDRCGTPRKIAIQAVCAAAQRDDAPDWLAYNTLRWLAYCIADAGKSIYAPGIFIARKIEQDETCPEYFETDYSHPLHGEIRTLEMQLE